MSQSSLQCRAVESVELRKNKTRILTFSNFYREMSRVLFRVFTVLIVVQLDHYSCRFSSLSPTSKTRVSRCHGELPREQKARQRTINYENGRNLFRKTTDIGR